MKELSNLIAVIAISASGVAASADVDNDSEKKQVNGPGAVVEMPVAYHANSQIVRDRKLDLSLAKEAIEQALFSNFLEERISVAG